MKYQRLKKVQKKLGFFVNNYKFRAPYQVLIDGNFCVAALENKCNLQDQLPKYFGSEVKLLTTQCLVLEIEKLAALNIERKLHGAMLILKQFAVHKCGHEKKPVAGSKCLMSMVGSNNSSRYVIATQDRSIQDKLREVPGVPIMYLHGNAPTLESPSQKSRELADQLKNKTISDEQAQTIKSLKIQAGLDTEDAIKPPKKKKKKGGPNPLSCKKKKKKPTVNANIKKNNNNEDAHLRKVNESGKIKKKRIKLPAHVKEVLFAQKKETPN